MAEKLDLISMMHSATDLSGNIDLKDFLERLLKVVNEVVGADRIVILCGKGGCWRIQAIQEGKDAIIETQHPIPLEETSKLVPRDIFYKTIQAKKIEVVHSFIEDKLSELLAAPLIYQGELSGMIFLGRYSKDHPFSVHDQEVLNALSHQITSSYQNGILYFELAKTQQYLCDANKMLELKTSKLEAVVHERTSELREKNEKLERSLHALEKMQHEMIQQDRLACLGVISHGVAQAIVEPINAIETLSSKLKRTLDQFRACIIAKKTQEAENLLDSLKNDVKKIRELSRSVDRIVMSMIQQALPHRGEKESVSINDLVKENVELIKKRLLGKAGNPAIKIETIFDPTNPSLNIVPLEVGRAFFNLLDYICRSLLENMCRQSERLIDPAVTVSVQRLEGAVEIIIRDNGLGISKEDLPKLFIPFSNPAEESGLGLLIARDIIVQEHEGRLDVQSEEGKYSEFIIQLPLK